MIIDELECSLNGTGRGEDCCCVKGEAGYSQSAADLRPAMSGFVGAEGVCGLVVGLEGMALLGLVDARDEGREREREEERREFVVVGEEGLEW